MQRMVLVSEIINSQFKSTIDISVTEVEKNCFMTFANSSFFNWFRFELKFKITFRVRYVASKKMTNFCCGKTCIFVFHLPV